MGNKVSANDVKEALAANPVATTIGTADGSRQNITPQGAPALNSEIYDMSGKKLKCDFVVIRNGKEFAFKKGTAWEAIADEYKKGRGQIFFNPADFE